MWLIAVTVDIVKNAVGCQMSLWVSVRCSNLHEFRANCDRLNELSII